MVPITGMPSRKPTQMAVAAQVDPQMRTTGTGRPAGQDHTDARPDHVAHQRPDRDRLGHGSGSADVLEPPQDVRCEHRREHGDEDGSVRQIVKELDERTQEDDREDAHDDDDLGASTQVQRGFRARSWTVTVHWHHF